MEALPTSLNIILGCSTHNRNKIIEHKIVNIFLSINLNMYLGRFFSKHHHHSVFTTGMNGAPDVSHVTHIMWYLWLKIKFPITFQSKNRHPEVKRSCIFAKEMKAAKSQISIFTFCNIIGALLSSELRLKKCLFNSDQSSTKLPNSDVP